MMTKERAEKEGTKLVEELGDGWVPRVYDLLGWKVKAVSQDGRMTIYPDHTNDSDVFCVEHYTVVVGAFDCIGFGGTPRRAVDDALMKDKLQLSCSLDAHSFVDADKKFKNRGEGSKS